MTWGQLDDYTFDQAVLYEGRTLEPHELPSVAW